MTNYEKINLNHETGIEMEEDDSVNSSITINKNDKSNNSSNNNNNNSSNNSSSNNNSNSSSRGGDSDDKDLIKIKVKNAEDPIIYIKLKGTDKIQLFKSTILKQKDKPPHYNCRIIYNGKMLRDDQTISECKLNNESVVICSITEPLNIQPTIAIIPNPTTTTTTTTDINNIPHPFTPPQRQNIHQDFILDMERTRVLLNGGGGGGIDIDDANANGGGTFTQNNRSFMFVGENSAARESLELFFGLSFGFFFGPLSLFWISKSYLSRTAKLGIVMGVIFSVSLSLVRMSSTQATS
ncbi:hypothetical protein RB653_004195 [Dictyostelium firmibasis]|uniref:Ubiquitin-like domain-containing protein n=1 Tax=Dictyostelium firmibasis TaxID=79012 RepID=A0AAN7U7F9_9MYCE